MAAFSFTEFLDSENGKGLLGLGLSVICIYMIYKGMQQQRQLEARVTNLEYKTYSHDILLKQIQDTILAKNPQLQASFITPVSGVQMQGVQTNYQMPGGMPGAGGPMPNMGYGGPGVGTNYAFNRQKL